MMSLLSTLRNTMNWGTGLWHQFSISFLPLIFSLPRCLGHSQRLHVSALTSFFICNYFRHQNVLWDEHRFFFLPQRLIWDAKKLGDLFMSQVKSVVHLGIQLWILKFHIADWQNASKVPYSWQSQLCVNTRRWNVEGAKVATQMTLYLLKLFKKNHKIIQIFLQASRQQSNWSRGKKNCQRFFAGECNRI